MNKFHRSIKEEMKMNEAMGLGEKNLTSLPDRAWRERKEDNPYGASLEKERETGAFALGKGEKKKQCPRSPMLFPKKRRN